MTDTPPTFREVFDQHLPFVWSTLRRLGVPDADREDVAHDVFLHVFRHWPDYDPTRPLRAWIFVFAARAASDHRRRARHRYEVLGEVDESAAAASNAEPMRAREQQALLNEALQSVEAPRREVLLLHELEGLAIPEVAQTLGIPLNTAYSRLRVAREELGAAVKRIQARGAR